MRNPRLTLPAGMPAAGRIARQAAIVASECCRGVTCGTAEACAGSDAPAAAEQKLGALPKDAVPKNSHAQTAHPEITFQIAIALAKPFSALAFKLIYIETNQAKNAL
jgi:hypothetical protein